MLKRRRAPPAPAGPAQTLYRAEAKEQGFRQFVGTIATTFLALPLTWLIVILVMRDKVPHTGLYVWAGLFFAIWLASVVALRRYRRAGPTIGRHLRPVALVVIAEGLLWGGMLYVLMGHGAETDIWALVLLVGVVAVVLPSYIAYPQTFRMLLASIWLAAFTAVALRLGLGEAGMTVVLCLLSYFLGLVYTIHPIATRVREGIRLQLVNDALTAQLKESLAAVSRQADTDALTGQLNRHALNRLLDELIVKGERRRTGFALLMIDIDHFKSINDTHGHDVGDLALRHVAQCVAAQLRDGDACARYGGEEFIVLLPATSEAEARQVAERVRSAVEASPLAQPRLVITLSIGLSSYHPGMSAEALLKAADSAVYLAKRNGRNQVSVSALACA